MYHITQLYTRTRHGWVPATSFIVNLKTNDQSVRSYLGAFFGPLVERSQSEWESESWPTEQDVISHGPRGTISAKQYDELESRAAAEYNALWNERQIAKKQSKQQRRKRWPWVVTGILIATALLLWIVL